MTQLLDQLLTPQSTLSLLPACESQLDIEAIGQHLLEHFQAQPELPGILITENGQPKGVIPQAKFFARLNQPFGRELYLKRPVQILLEAQELQAPPLVLPHTCPIIDAVEAALSRPSEFIYDPIVLATEGESQREYLLLNCHTVLLAQAQILHQINAFISRQQEETAKLKQELTQAQSQCQTYATQLSQIQADSHRHQEILEHQNRELRAQAKQISRINQQLLGMGQLVSSDSEQAVQATMTAANSIAREFNQVLRLGGILEQELEIIDGANHEIEHISKQVKHLALQASLIIGRAGGQFTAFNFITTEINKLGEQCVHANKQIAGMAQRFRERIPEVTQAAQTGEATTRELIAQIRPAELSLSQFGSLVKQLENPN